MCVILSIKEVSKIVRREGVVWYEYRDASGGKTRLGLTLTNPKS